MLFSSWKYASGFAASRFTQLLAWASHISEFLGGGLPLPELALDDGVGGGGGGLHGGPFEGEVAGNCDPLRPFLFSILFSDFSSRLSCPLACWYSAPAGS